MQDKSKMPVSLPSGKVIWMTLDQYLNIDYNYLWSIDAGDWVDDPFYESQLIGIRTVADDDFDRDLPDLDIEIDIEPMDE